MGRAVSTVIAALLALSCMPIRSAGAGEIRGVWFEPDAFDTRERRTATLAEIRQGNLNTVFLACPPLNGNYGWSRASDFGTFLSMVKAARPGTSVHVWLTNLERRGVGTRADFTSRNEQLAQRKWALDMIAKYPTLDGVHFDYIRYADWDDCRAKKMNGIKETIRITHDALRALSPRRFLTCTSFVAEEPSYQGWNEEGVLYWEGDVPGWYRKWYVSNVSNWYIRESRTNPDYDPHWILGPLCLNFQQDSRSWVAEGALDYVFPMQYTTNVVKWQQEARLWNSFLGGLGKVCMGLGWFTEEGSPDWGYNPQALVKHIKYGRRYGIAGFSIYTLGLPGIDDRSLISALTVNGKVNDYDAPFKTFVPSPLLAR